MELSNWVTEHTMAADCIRTRDGVVEKPTSTLLERNFHQNSPSRWMEEDGSRETIHELQVPEERKADQERKS